MTAERVETVTCDHCGDDYDPQDVEPCDHGWWLCSTCDANGACRHCGNDREQDRLADVAADEAREVRA